ncbi:hypothetical protein L596_007665 [Steinernema carpocapsae]|uniref:CID domain-containing protein n=1 Tax=Steinernema carpocapsae TaxID=34508 RepID=A0A4U5PAF2_STECR|nr:hypothetical protein L596_007665 [Steinernema carpocapsae]
MNSSHSEEKIQKRFESIKNTPDSIQSIALWVQHHRSSLATITSVWIHVYKASDDTRRLALFYLTNEICQNTKLREKTDEFTNAFFPFILKAISISRVSDIVKDKIVKVVNLFEERRIFSSDQLAQMRKIQEEEIAADFDHSSITTEIENFRECTILALKGHKMLCHPDFSFTKYFKPKITDRIEGEKVIEEMESCLNRARAFTKLCDEHNERTGSVLGFVESAKKFYSIQLRDVAVVEDAYQKYFSGIQVVKRELLEMKRSGVYPGATPPRTLRRPLLWTTSISVTTKRIHLH